MHNINMRQVIYNTCDVLVFRESRVVSFDLFAGLKRGQGVRDVRNVRVLYDKYYRNDLDCRVYKKPNRDTIYGLVI